LGNSSSNNNKDRVLVYSTDPKDQAILNGTAGKDKKIATLKEIIDSRKFVIVFRLETASRGGKTVTVLDKIPAYEPFVKELTKELKVKCGVGGSCNFDGEYANIEIQGDKRLAIKKILDGKQIKYKGM
jgi:translation initiation factor 1